MKKKLKCLCTVAWRGLFCVFILLGLGGVGGSSLRAEESHKLLHLVEPLRQICGGYSAVSERLDDLQLLDEEVIKRINFWSVGLVLEPSRVGLPLLGGFDVVLPVGYGSLQGKFPEMSDVRDIGVRTMPQRVGSTLPPSIEEKRDGTDRSATEHSGSSSNNRNALYVFLFLWGHEWWVLAIWWGIIAFVILVHADFIYGMIYEWKISSQNA